MEVRFGRDAAAFLSEAGLDVRYSEHPGAHHLGPDDAATGAAFLAEVLA